METQREGLSLLMEAAVSLGSHFDSVACAFLYKVAIFHSFNVYGVPTTKQWLSHVVCFAFVLLKPPDSL